MSIAAIMRGRACSRRTRAAWAVVFWAIFWTTALAQPICDLRAGSHHGQSEHRGTVVEDAHSHGPHHGDTAAEWHDHAPAHDHRGSVAHGDHGDGHGTCCCDELAAPVGTGPARDAAPMPLGTPAGHTLVVFHTTDAAPVAALVPPLEPPRHGPRPYLSTSRLRL